MQFGLRKSQFQAGGNISETKRQRTRVGWRMMAREGRVTEVRRWVKVDETIKQLIAFLLVVLSVLVLLFWGLGFTSRLGLKTPYFGFFIQTDQDSPNTVITRL